MNRMIALVWLLAARPAAAADCPGAYQDPQYRQVWTLAKDSWLADCARGKSPADILAEAKARFIAECVDDAAPAIHEGLIAAEAAKDLCSQGLPGKARIPRNAGAVRVSRISQAVQAHLNADIAGLYGDRGTAIEAAPLVPPPLGAAVLIGPAQGAVRAQAVNAPPPPRDAQRDKNIGLIAGRIADHGASPEAVASARKLLTGMLDQADPAVVLNLAAAHIKLVIIPKDKKMTDLPEFASLKGKKTFDGRLWDDVRGVGSVWQEGGGYAFGIAEESLTGDRGYVRGYVLVHEFGHLVQDLGLPHDLEAESNRIYDEAVKRKEKTGLGKYADSNAREHFAQASAAFFGLSNYGRNDEVKDAETLRRADPNLYRLLVRIYGPPRQLAP